MLIFVQVCRTKDKNVVSIFKIFKAYSERTNESNGINKKEVWSIWRKDVLKTKCSWSADVIRSTSSEARSPEAVFIRSWRSSEAMRIKASKGCSNDLISSNIAEDWKNKATTNSNGFEGIGCFYVGESWQRTIVRTIQPLSPLLCFLPATRQEKQLCLHQCPFRLGMNLTLILHRTITILGKRSLVILIKLQTTLFDVLAISNVSFTPLYKGVKTC